MKIVCTSQNTEFMDHAHHMSLVTEIMIRWYCLIKWNVKMFTFSI